MTACQCEHEAHGAACGGTPAWSLRTTWGTFLVCGGCKDAGHMQPGGFAWEAVRIHADRALPGGQLYRARDGRPDHVATALQGVLDGMVAEQDRAQRQVELNREHAEACAAWREAYGVGDVAEWAEHRYQLLVCPGCGGSSPAGAWPDHPMFCEDCGEHGGAACPLCGDAFDVIWDANDSGPRVVADLGAPPRPTRRRA